MFVYILSSAGLLGLLMFEASRLFGFEYQLKDDQLSPPAPASFAPNLKHPRSAA
jgi:hypothetical protein